MREIELANRVERKKPKKLSVPEAEAWYADYKRLGGKGSEEDFITEMETYMHWWKARGQTADNPEYIAHTFNKQYDAAIRPEEDIFDVLGQLHNLINRKQACGKLPGLI
jgi:hypothetical protein